MDRQDAIPISAETKDVEEPVMSGITLERVTERIEEQLSRQTYPEGFPRLPPVPTKRFSDQGFAALERELVWGKAWLLTCLASELPEPGAYVLFERCGASIIVSRGRDDVVRAFHNVCRHRAAALLTAPRGKALRFVCPYHSWGYALDGTLKAVPEEHNFACLSKEERSLVPVRCETWRGMVFINLDADAGPLGDAMAPLAGQTAGFPIEDLVVHDRYSVEMGCNWKLALHNFVEGYHTTSVHAKTLAPLIIPRSLTVALLNKGHARIAVRKAKGNSIYSNASNDGDPVDEVYRQYSISVASFPNVFCALDPNGFAIQSFWPLSENRSVMDISLVGFGSSPSTPDYWSGMRAIIDTILAEDMSLFEGIQRGVESAAAPDIIMGHQERTPYWMEEEIDRRIGPARIPPGMAVQQVLAAHLED
jgi:phenylpropionate dioxygenase-like ring-hydroxylating dioxygenase large terminal subunit